AQPLVVELVVSGLQRLVLQAQLLLGLAQFLHGEEQRLGCFVRHAAVSLYCLHAPAHLLEAPRELLSVHCSPHGSGRAGQGRPSSSSITRITPRESLAGGAVSGVQVTRTCVGRPRRLVASRLTSRTSASPARHE